MKRGLVPVRGPIFQIQNLALLPAEDGDDQIEFAVAVEVPDAHVADAPHSVEQDDGREPPLTISPQPDDAPGAVIGGLQAPQVGDHQILDAVTVQIDDFHVTRTEYIGQQAATRRTLVGLHHPDLSGVDVAHDHVEFVVGKGGARGGRS